MKELFDWIPWFEELAVQVGEVRREGLVERAKEVDWAGLRRAVLAQGDEKADPLTFFYHLASIKGPKRRTVYASVAKAFGIERDLDYGLSDGFIFPQGVPRNVEFHDTGEDPNLLWDMFDQARACGPDGESSDAAIADTFAKSLKVKGAGIAKLTQTLFMINPRSFLPFDTAAVLPLGIGEFEKPPGKLSWTEYLKEMRRIRTAFPGCAPYEINIIGYLWTSGYLPREGNRWYQIVTSDDRWRDFLDNHWVQSSGESATEQVPSVSRAPIVPGPVVERKNPEGEDQPVIRSFAMMVNEGEVVRLERVANRMTRPDYSKPDPEFGYRVVEAVDGLEHLGKEAYGIGASQSKTWVTRHIREAIKDGRFRPGEQGDMHRLGEGATLPRVTRDYQVNEPKRGDVVLVRSATQEGRGIGIVYRNEYSGRPNRDGPIHVLWVNKNQAPLLAELPTVRFSRADRSTYEAFAKSAAYSPTVDLLSSPNAPPPTTVHRLNQILYGPPGTSKTYSTTALGMAIVKGIEVDAVTDEHRTEFRSLRFDPMDGTGQIAMVTFHQNYSYEDFVEGIRPRLVAGSDIDFELRRGVFRRIVDAALADPDRPYVLIIDEINRGNIPKILGELITLIEPSRRLGREDETMVTLPYSGDSFGVPDNLHIIGTMNTADRSILPLDTALRRRFEHVEMMPDPDHPRIADSVADINLRKMLGAINARISLLLDRERQIGHTYLFNVKDIESLAAKFRTAILPLLAEYFYDDWSKIRRVLNGADFVVVKKGGEHASALVNEGLLDRDIAVHEVLPATAKEWRDPIQYRRIYANNASVGSDQREDENPDTGDDQP